MTRFSVYLVTTLILLVGMLTNSYAQFGPPQDLVKGTTYLSLDKSQAGTQLKLAFEITIDSTWHINSNKPYDESLIPSELSVSSDNGFTLVNAVYPKGHDYTFEFSDDPLSVYEGTVIMGGILKVPDSIALGTHSFVVELGYQACNNITCFAPTTLYDTVDIEIVDNQTQLQPVNEEKFKDLDISYTTETVEEKSGEDEDSVSSLLEESGLLVGLILVFLGGLALNLTPCVYPLIPITVGFFGGQSEGRTSRLAVMGLLYVLGLALTYSVIGVVTSLSGALFGELLREPIVLIFIGVVLLGLSLSMFGVYEFKLPDSWVAKAGGSKGGMYGAFFMGLTMGIVAAPCIGPFVLGLVTYVAKIGEPFTGFLLFFFLALGLGTPYFILAIFSGKIKQLPRSGLWMEAVKHIFGFILVGMAIYFVLPIIPKPVNEYILPVYMILAALYILFFDKAANNMKGFKIFKNVLAVAVIAFAVYSFIPNEHETISWPAYDAAQYETAIKEPKPLIIDFSAEWCNPCKELEEITFADPTVKEELQRFTLFKADLTQSGSPEVEELSKQFNVIGVPTILLMNSDGEEVERITGFLPPEDFLKKLEKVK